MKVHALVMAAFALFFQTVQAATITTDPFNSTVGLNSVFTINITGEGFPETQGGGFNLAWDPTILDVNSVSIDGGVWDFTNDLGSINNVSGTLSEVKVSAFPGVNTGSFIVATVEFLAVGLGSSNLALTESTGNPWASDGSPIGPTFTTNGSITVSSVPIPAAAWLFGSGFVGLIGIARRKKAA